MTLLRIRQDTVTTRKNSRLTDRVVTTNATGDEDEAPVPTDSSGIAVAQDLRPGIYAVSVWTDELTIVPRYFVVEPGAAIRVELRP